MKATIERFRACVAPALAASALLLAACGGGSDAGGSNHGNGGNGGNPPPPPAVEFVAFGTSGRTASLRWTPVPGATGYAIERRTATTAFAPIATLATDADAFVDEGLEQNTEYRYRFVPAGVNVGAVEKSATTSADMPVSTATGGALGTAAEAAIDATGGSVATADGRVRLVLPAGAVPAGTVAALQPIANTAPGGLGAAVRVRVATVPDKPITLTLGYAPELDASVDGLGVAVQRADGSWLSAPISAVDKGARTLTVKLPPTLAGSAEAGGARPQAIRPAAASGVSLVADVVTYLDFHLSPREATIKTGATRLLVPYARTVFATGRFCTPVEDGSCLWLPILETREVPFENRKAGYTRRWFVFAEEGGTPALGTITPRSGTGAVYQAPMQMPTPNPVLVTFASTHDQSGRTLTLTSSIRVEEPVWTGIVSGTLAATGGDLAFRFSMQAVWTAVEGSNGTVFRANGTQSVSVIDMNCDGEVSPDTVPLPPGALTIDHSVEPPRFTLDVGSVWKTVLSATCPNGSGSVPMDVPSRLQIEGAVGGNGTKIDGERVLNGISWGWALTSEL